MPKGKRNILLAVAGVLVVGLVASSVLLLTHTGGSRTPVSTGQTKTIQSHPTEGTQTQKLVSPTPIPSIKGVQLVIPSIKVDAPIEPVGIVTSGPNKGTLAVPTRAPWTDTGWYDLGTYPGNPGSAVIDGHLNRPGGCCIPAVFWNLKLLHVGDSVSVIIPGVAGKTLHFRVTRVQYLNNNAPTAAIFNRTGGTYLNLITCAGDWIPSQHQTTQRLVVYTTLV
jgi:hypothetical protein